MKNKRACVWGIAALAAMAWCVPAPAEPDASSGTYVPMWDSLKKYEVPEWYLDAKFGIFIHWGVYSVPAFGNEWYPRNMYKEHSSEFLFHQRSYGSQSEFGYKDFIPLFTAEKFDPKHWAAVFRDAGAKFVVPVAEHHDGFAMYDCSLSKWNAAQMGPKRDVIGELAQAVREAGMVFGVSSHRAEHWWFFNEGMKFASDVREGQWQDLYGPAQPDKTQPDTAFLEDWLARNRELVDKYKPQLFWFDWWIEQPAFEPYLREFAAYYYNRGREWNQGVAINYKNQTFPEGTAVLDIERGKLGEIRPFYWQTDTSISEKSWGYIDGDKFRSVDSLVDDLIDIISKNGCLLLNIGPTSEGVIPKEAEGILLGIGEWLGVNGEAVYGTRPWRVFGEGPTEVKSGSFTDTRNKQFTGKDFRFTAKGNAVYVCCLAWPEKKVEVAALGKKSLDGAEVAEVSMLGLEAPVPWKHTKENLIITRPDQRPCHHAYVFKVVMK